MLLQLRRSPVVRNACAIMFRSWALTQRELARVSTLPVSEDGDTAAERAQGRRARRTRQASAPGR